ncbi:EipA family protein [Desulfopila sp. IMCC35008]|uniref:EipA family protein n=1 Tax=Desulfopila sp. IMCC35008 TaxID=2653858 RepID=UPI0013D4045E|nr:EipA family protein [Desulfopila sp. IMCC35008]
MMGKRKLKQILLKTLIVFTLAVPFASLSFAAKQAEGEIADTAVAVDVVVGIDKDTRVITLKNEAGESYEFIAGHEVMNFDQIKRGDMVIMEYYSGFAFALEPKGSGLKEKASVLTIQVAKSGEKPGMKITGARYVAAEIVSIDKEHGVVILEGTDHVLALKVSDSINLADLQEGQKIEALYTESYAVSVIAAPKVSGTVKINTKAVAVGIGMSWGKGTLTMYDGSLHDFSIQGLSLVDVGVTSVEAIGEVYNLVEAKDMEGIFVAGEAGAALVGGGSVLALKNGNHVVMKLKTTQKGLRLSLAGQGLKVKLK